MPEGIVPWVRAADPAANFMEAYRAGAVISNQRAQLNQQAEQAEIETQAQEQRLQRESAMASQRLEMDRQLKLATMGLQRQRLEAAQQAVSQRASLAARQYAAQQAYEKAITAGMDPTKALMTFGPGMGNMSGAMAAAERVSAKSTPQMPQSLQGVPVMFKGQEEPGLVTVPTPTGYRTMERPGYVGEQAGKRTEKFHATQNRISVLKADRAQLLKDNYRLSQNRPPDAKDKPGTAAYNEAKAKLNALNDELNQLAPKVGTQGTAPAGGGEIIRTTKDGRQAVFDASSKQFKRWAEAASAPDEEQDQEEE